MARLTRRALIQTGAVAVGGMGFAIPAFMQQANAQAQAQEPPMFINISRATVAPGAASEIAWQVQASLVPLIGKEPGFLGYYLLSVPERNEVVTISMFREQAAAESAERKTLQWIKQHIATLLPGGIQFTTGQVQVHKSA
jgi:heme-degrading monooxygenase HmoA